MKGPLPATTPTRETGSGPLKTSASAPTAITSPSTAKRPTSSPTPPTLMATTPTSTCSDLLTNTTILVSDSTAGAHTGGNAPSNHPVISSDGSTVAFDSLANDLDPSYTGLEPFDNYQVYASTLNYTNDTVSATHLVSVDPTGTTAGNGTSIEPSLSDNGQIVAFQSAAENLVSTPNGGSYNDIYVRDLATSTTQLVSVNDTNTATGDSSSFAPQISGDGDHVLFYSLADDLTSNATDGNENVFERNLTTNTTQMVSVSATSTAGGAGWSYLANQTLENASQQVTGQISDNGQYVVFQSVADNLVANYVPENLDLAPTTSTSICATR